MKNLKLTDIINDTVYAVELEDEYGRHWITGTLSEVEWAFNSENLSDIDMCCDQPEHLRQFYADYEAYRYSPECTGFLTVEDFYHIWKEAA